MEREISCALLVKNFDRAQERVRARGPFREAERKFLVADPKFLFLSSLIIQIKLRNKLSF